ncbi:MAG: pyruvate ferredoxin oxidoreductase [Candidatus Bathyarchaeota archaeon]|nr:pyruvate ferredoxin oxidoreductase [Candidatus Bathyarchaeota archaeon]
MSYEVMVGNKAAATACKLARVQVASAFPITPQTTITQYLSEMHANAEWDFDFVNVEGELSSQVVVQGASRVGARTFTCTSGPGLLYMHHPMQTTGSSRLPVVMAVVHRGYKGMQPDHSDLMSQQWTGWGHIYVEHAQEVLDSLLMAYKVAEDPRIRIPIAVGYDGYVLSYTAEPVEIPEQSLVDEWLPPNKPMPSILPDEVDPETFSRGWGGGDPQMPWKIHHEAILKIEDVLKETMDSFEKTFGRRYGNGMIEPYMMEDADCAIIAMGTIAGTAKAAVEKMQNEGKKVGLIKLRSYIPFPENDLKEWAKKLDGIAVVDRSICPGKGGPVYGKLKSVLYELEDKPKMLQFHAGLGGKEVRTHDFEMIGDKLLKAVKGETVDPVTWV